MQDHTIAIIALIVSGLAFIAGAGGLTAGLRLKKWRALFKPETQPDNLEEVLTTITERLKILNSGQIALQNKVEENGQILETAFRYSSVVRFNSGSTDGGNLSFALALLDGQQNGLIVTSIHGREHNRIYCKAVSNGQPQQALNEEEQQALIEAVVGKIEPSKIVKPKRPKKNQS